MKRALVACLLLPACAPPSEDADFEVAEASIVELQDAMLEGRVTSAQLVDLYLARVRAYDRAGPALNTIVRLNPGRGRRRTRWTRSGRRARCADRCTGSRC